MYVDYSCSGLVHLNLKYIIIMNDLQVRGVSTCNDDIIVM